MYPLIIAAPINEQAQLPKAERRLRQAARGLGLPAAVVHSLCQAIKSIKARPVP